MQNYHDINESNTENMDFYADLKAQDVTSLHAGGEDGFTGKAF